MERHNILRPTVLFLAIGAWVFLLLSLASFRPSDWPSHQVYPHPPIQNLCGQAGAFVAYYLFLAIGQGVFPVLFFSGVCLTLWLVRNRVSDVWLRVMGMMLLAVAFATMVHHLRPGAPDAFPEGHGGIVGIAASNFLHTHFNTVGTRLILLTSLLIGLLLAADDLVLRAPAMVGSTFTSMRRRTAGIQWDFIPSPSLPSLPRLNMREVLIRSAQKALPAPARKARGDEDEEEDDLKPPVIYKRVKSVEAEIVEQQDEEGELDEEEIDLTYDHDEPAPAADDAAYADDADPRPSERAIIPPPGEQAPPPPKNDIVVKLPNTLKPRQVSPPPPPPKELGEYHLPNWDILEEAEYDFAESQEQFVREQAAVLEQALREFGIQASVVEIDTGPVITMYAISIAPGTKVSQITALSNDIARALAATSVRIVAPIPGKNTVGIEAPNAQKEKVRLKELMQLAPDATKKMAIPLYLGKDASGEPLITDMAAMPHCLIAGTTGSGKSVCINTIIMSIMYMQRPDMVKLILVDPKVVEMAPFKDVPHLMCPVINDAVKATSVLEWACEKMDERYEFLAEAGVRNIKGYNSLTREELIERFDPSSEEEEAKIPKHLPYILIIIDELADLMMTSGKEVESFIVRIAQKARAVGIHLILATQRPQATVVTGLIKSNMPSKIAFRVASKMDSRIVLDQNGADLLLGQGDMLFLPPGASKPIRAQGTFIDDKEIRDSVKLVRGLADAQYEPDLVQIKAGGGIDDDAVRDELFDDAVKVVLETKRGSVSLLQRRLTIGYSRASRLIEAMAAAGIVGSYKGSQAREALITIEEWEAMRAQMNADAEDGMSV
jgi:DNA segregation ATPase FtsK/SpoIIIE, S-DNA-T family